MFPVLRIATRNLNQHRRKTLIIGSIVALGVAVLIVGNSLMETARLGIRRAFVENYTGHVMVSGLSRGEISLFGVASVGGVEDTPVLPSYRTIREFASSIDGVADMTPQLTSFARFGVDEVDGRSFTLLFGIDPDSYFRMFDRIDLVEGRLPRPGERGIVLSVQRADSLIDSIRRSAEEDDAEPQVTELETGMPIAVSSAGAGGFRIRVVPLLGVYEPISGEAVGSEYIAFIDAPTLRSLTGLGLGAAADIALAEEETALLDADDFDALFAGDVDDDALFGDSLFDDVDDGGDDRDWDDLFAGLDEADERPTAEDPLDEADDRSAAADPFADPFAETDEQAAADPAADDEEAAADIEAAVDGGPWNFLLLRLDSLRDTDRVTGELNAFFEEEGIAATAWNWEQAAGPFATTADVVRVVFNVAIVIVGVVAAIIIMNTLVISVIERTGEIGTMRALGAQRFFVWRLFFVESLVITGLFGAIGIGIGSAVVGALNVIGIPATTTFLEVLFAGPELRPVLSASTLLGSVAVVALIAVLSHIYPVSVALKVQPVRAMKAD